MDWDTLNDEPTLASRPADTAPGFSFSAGDVLGGHRIERLLGRGGMGEVYLAVNVQNGTRGALKVLSQKTSSSPKFAEQFRTESRVMTELDHPHIVRVRHMAEENGLFFLLMDYVACSDGQVWTLETLLQEKGRLEESLCREMALQVARALHCGHSHPNGPVIHCDLKPSNILLKDSAADGRWTAKLSDFGIARVGQNGSPSGETLSGLDTEDTLSTEDTLVPGDGGQFSVRPEGTPAYMAPELLSGAEPSVQSDMYALGVTLYRMLTGSRPGGMIQPPSSFGCDSRWDSIISRCLDADPRRRYAGADILIWDLEQVQQSSGSRFGWWWALPAAAVIAILLFFVTRPQSPRETIIVREKVVEELPPMETRGGGSGGFGGGGTVQESPVSGWQWNTDQKGGQIAAIGLEFILVPNAGVYLGTREVSNAAFRKFRPDFSPVDFMGQKLDRPDCPVVQVTLADAEAYAEWLNRSGAAPKGWKYRLPTADEWEAAAAAAEGLSGNKADRTMARVFQDWRYDANCNDRYAVTSPCGSFPPSSAGIHDLEGNVLEWTGSRTSKGVIVKGSCWSDPDRFDPSTTRTRLPQAANAMTGFRLALAKEDG